MQHNLQICVIVSGIGKSWGTWSYTSRVGPICSSRRLSPGSHSTTFRMDWCLLLMDCPRTLWDTKRLTSRTWYRYTSPPTWCGHCQAVSVSL